MNASELVRAGRLGEAIDVLVAEVRDQPTDGRRRTLLFELLSFACQFERAGKHLNLLSQVSKDAEIGVLLYQSALAAERKRQALFESREYPNARGESKLLLPGT